MKFMEASGKVFYEAPATVVFEVRTRGAFLQTSEDPPFNGFGNEEDM